jgi:hypothetical protein
VETKLQEMFEIIQTKILNTFDWIDEKLNWNLLTVNTFKKSGKQVGIECDEYELCCSEPLDNFCQDLREKHTFGGNIVRAGQVD